MDRQVIVVGGDDLDLYHALRADWAADHHVTVVLDRRLAQRRCSVVAPAVERRRRDRRQSAPIDAYLTWRGGGVAARKSDVMSALGKGSFAITVRRRSGGPVTSESARPPQRDAHSPRGLIGPGTSLLLAITVLLGTVVGGIFGGVALWLFMMHELPARFAQAKTHRPRGSRYFAGDGHQKHA